MRFSRNHRNLLREAYRRGYRKALKENSGRNQKEIFSMKLLNVLQNGFNKLQDESGVAIAGPNGFKRLIRSLKPNLQAISIESIGLPIGVEESVVEEVVGEFFDIVDDATGGALSMRLDDLDKQEKLIEDCVNFIISVIEPNLD